VSNIISSVQSTTHTTQNAILLLDKPQGLTSQQAVSKVKRLFQVSKAGHTGTLDPIATGLLPICLGEATKFSHFLLNTDKHYQVQATLGICTDTGDSEGNILSQTAVPIIKETDLLEVLSTFIGDIEQIPPMFSAIKHKGRPLYEWARKGIEISRQPRSIKIHELKLLHYENSQLHLEVRCSKGTYIRSLIQDIGTKLGCGGHMSALRRLSVGDYSLKDSVDFETLEAHSNNFSSFLLSLDTALPQWPLFKISEAAAFYLKRGQTLVLPNMPPQGWVQLVMKTNQQFAGVGQVLHDGRLKAYRMLYA